MQPLIIGTVGHVDHGKTALVKALTGTDTDRLAEEKQRGMTIDLGFAHFTLPDGTPAGVIDLPGHERFLKNMLSGAGAIDLVLMVIAADEGIMPQTQEHLDIVTLLGVTCGLIVLTKCAIADAETLALAKEEIAQWQKGTALESAPIVEVDSLTGQGIDRLREKLMQAAASMPPYPLHRPLWMPIDRVFSVSGFGTVVTGTLLDGTMQVGDTLYVCPSGDPVRVRGLQIGGVQTDQAQPHQRVAVNLSGVKKERLGRGNVLAGKPCASHLLDVKIQLVAQTKRELCHGARVHLAMGTASVVCRVLLSGGGRYIAGQTGFARLKPETPIAARAGERFVLRFYSPLETMGGGVVLDAAPAQKRLDKHWQERLNLYDTGSLEEQLMWETAHGLCSQSSLKQQFDQAEPYQLEQAIRQLIAEGKLCLAGEHLLPPSIAEQWKERLLAALGQFHSEHPLADGMPLASLRNSIPEQLVAWCIEQGIARQTGSVVALHDHSPLHTQLYQAIREQLMACYRMASYMPPDRSQAVAQCTHPAKWAERVLTLLAEQGELIPLSDSLLMDANSYDTAKETTARLIAQQGQITLAQLRDALGISRKYAQLILERMDETGFTQKSGDARILA